MTGQPRNEHTTGRRVRRMIGAAVVVAACAAPAVAAADPAYPGTPPNQVEGNTLTREPAQEPTQVLGVQQSRGQTLPFTGADVAELTVLGVGLVGVGTVLVRRSRRTA